MAVTFTAAKCPKCGGDISVESGRSETYCSYCGAKLIVTNDNEIVMRTVDEASVNQTAADYLVRMKELEIAETRRKEKQEEDKRNMIISAAVVGVGLIFVIFLQRFSIVFLLGFVMICCGAFSFFNILSGKSKASYQGTASFTPSYKNRTNGYGTDAYRGAGRAGGAQGNGQVLPPDRGTGRAGVGYIKLPGYMASVRAMDFTTLESLLRKEGFKNIVCRPLCDTHRGSLVKKPGMVESVTINGILVRKGGRIFPDDANVVISYHSYR